MSLSKRLISTQGLSIPNTNIITLTNTQKFDRNQVTPTNATRYTYSFWVNWSNFINTKRNMWLCAGAYPSAPREEIMWNSNGFWMLNYDGGASAQGIYNSPAVTVSNNVWYHYCFQKIGGSKPVLFINGNNLGTWSEPTGTPSGDGSNTRINSGSDAHRINGPQWASSEGMNASIAYCQFIDGSIQAPSAFTTTSGGNTIPAAYTGSWGNNGWQLLFGNTSAIGTDTSGNGNNFTTVPSATTGTAQVYY